jgi:hypothetical protein
MCNILQRECIQLPKHPNRQPIFLASLAAFLSALCGKSFGLPVHDIGHPSVILLTSENMPPSYNVMLLDFPL